MHAEKEQERDHTPTHQSAHTGVNRRESTPFRILFVCLGNICRSPAAHGIMQSLLEKQGKEQLVEVDSAGTYAGHAGELPDARMRQHAQKRGYRLTHRSRPVQTSDFETFDLIVGMDNHNLSTLHHMAPDTISQKKICRMTDFCSLHRADHVPDPYYGGASGFDHVLDLLEDACNGLLHKVTSDSSL